MKSGIVCLYQDWAGKSGINSDCRYFLKIFTAIFHIQGKKKSKIFFIPLQTSIFALPKIVCLNNR